MNPLQPKVLPWRTQREFEWMITCYNHLQQCLHIYIIYSPTCMGAGKRLYSCSSGVYSILSLQSCWAWEGGLGKKCIKCINKKPDITETMFQQFVYGLDSLCSFVIIRVKTCPQKLLPGRTICSLLSLDGYWLGWSLVDIWLTETFRGSATLGFILGDTKRKAWRER